jgi:hypothetical protein
MSEKLLDGLFRELTAPKLWQLLKSELGDPLVLDKFRPDRRNKRWVRARGPGLILHIFAGNVPNPAILSFVFGMLVKSVNVGKVSSKDPGFLDIYLESLKDAAPWLAKTNHLISSNDRSGLREWMKKVDLIVAYGSDETLKELKSVAPTEAPFIGYGHRLSIGLYTREALTRKNVRLLARKTALDVWMMDQRGCLSPVFLYAETGGEISSAAFSVMVFQELDRIARFDKIKQIPPEREGMRLANENLRKVKQISFVRPFHNLAEAIHAIKSFSGRLQAVALEAGLKRRKVIAEELSRLGANRVCRAGNMQAPPLTWHHDGKPNLASWLTWTDHEP